jgi:hypothetical protein
MPIHRIGAKRARVAVARNSPACFCGSGRTATITRRRCAWPDPSCLALVPPRATAAEGRTRGTSASPLVAVPLRLIQSTARRFSGKKRDAGTAHPADAEENHDPQSAARPTSNQTLTQQPHVENQRSLRMTVRRLPPGPPHATVSRSRAIRRRAAAVPAGLPSVRRHSPPQPARARSRPVAAETRRRPRSTG